MMACQSQCSEMVALSLSWWKQESNRDASSHPPCFSSSLLPYSTSLVKSCHQYRTDGKLFNLHRFKAKSKVNYTTIIEPQYVDDNIIAAHSSEGLTLNNKNT